ADVDVKRRLERLRLVEARHEKMDLVGPTPALEAHGRAAGPAEAADHAGRRGVGGGLLARPLDIAHDIARVGGNSRARGAPAALAMAMRDPARLAASDERHGAAKAMPGADDGFLRFLHVRLHRDSKDGGILRAIDLTGKPVWVGVSAPARSAGSRGCGS